MKYCSDCAHYLNLLPATGEHAQCRKAMVPSPVKQGEYIRGYLPVFCSELRSPSFSTALVAGAVVKAEHCGPEAKWFQPITPE